MQPKRRSAAPCRSHLPGRAGADLADAAGAAFVDAMGLGWNTLLEGLDEVP